MKKLVLTSCCFLATIIFCTQCLAGNNGNEKDKKEIVATAKLPAASTYTITYCCVNAGVDVTLICPPWPNPMSTVLGKSCQEMDCTGDLCPNTWSWSPSTYLSSTTVQKPTWSRNCGDYSAGSITYTCTASGPNCAQLSDQVTVTWPRCVCAGRIGYFAADEEKKNKDIKVFPNPSTGKVSVELKAIPDHALLQVYDISGTLVKEIIIQEKTMEIDLSNQAKGTYFIQVIENDTGILNKKVAIK